VTALAVLFVQSMEPAVDGPPAFEALPPVELSRVRMAHEYIAIGGETLRVVSVRHVAGGDVAAELHCERLPALPSKGETNDTVPRVFDREAVR